VLLVTCYLTGWRIGQVLALRWEDVDLERGTAVSRGEDNKGRRDVLLPLHPMVVEHLRPLAGSFDPYVFPWNHNRRTLWTEFHRIQEATRLVQVDEQGRKTEKPLPKAGKEGWYGFHDLRRGFATENTGSQWTCSRCRP
jgi:integrase